jgi:CRP/FNR family transcriptional regulator
MSLEPGIAMDLLDFSKIKVSCRNCSLAELCLPHGLNRDELARLDSALRRSRPLHKGDCLYRPGDAAAALYAVRSGSVKLFTTLNDGEEQILGFYLPGEILGFDGIETGVHTCTAMALETSSACGISHAELKAICKQAPSFQDQMFRLFSRELSSDNELLLSITKRTADQRVAAMLTSLSARFQRIGYSSSEFRLSMSREEIGNYLGLTVETVSRVFGRLRTRRLIGLNRRQVLIIDAARLRALANGSDPGTSVPRRAAAP